LVRQRTAHILSMENLYALNSGDRLSCNAIKCLTEEQIQKQFADPNVALAIDSNRMLMNAPDQQINVLEQALLKQTQLNPRYRKLLTIDGVGEVLALTITLETGDMGRFAQVGNFTSYCRCVGSEKLSNGKKKGQGNSKNGNKYRAWAFVEAANFAIRFNGQAKRFHQRKAAKLNRVVALKTVAHKLARASYSVMRDPVPVNQR